MAKIVPILIAVIGVILLAGGVSAYMAKSGSTEVCEACGMEVAKDDISTIEILSSSGERHWACCPVCAVVVSLYYEDVSLHARCFGCGENITISFVNGNITSISPSGGTSNVTMIFGMSCTKNKLVCSDECASDVRSEYNWASALPSKTPNETLGIAQAKYSQFTVGYKPTAVPTITYGLVAGGLALLVAAPLEWRLIEKKKTGKEDKDA